MTTIRQLTTSKSIFVIGTIVALVTSAKQLGSQYVLEIKERHLEEDKNSVSTNSLSFVFYHLHIHFLLLILSILTQPSIAGLPIFHIHVRQKYNKYKLTYFCFLPLAHSLFITYA
jgi:hypothetical protein